MSASKISDTCPRQAGPGEYLAALRRWHAEPEWLPEKRLWRPGALAAVADKIASATERVDALLARLPEAAE